jgi:hypothetical protein
MFDFMNKRLNTGLAAQVFSHDAHTAAAGDTPGRSGTADLLGREERGASFSSFNRKRQTSNSSSSRSSISSGGSSGSTGGTAVVASTGELARSAVGAEEKMQAGHRPHSTS